MKRMINKAVLAAAVVFVTAGAAYAAPGVTNVVMAQRADSRIVDITYDLTGEAAIVTLGIETNGIALPDSAVTLLSGDVSVAIQPGAGKHVVWNAGADWAENLTQAAKARVTAWSMNAPPLIMVIDLSGGVSASSYPVTYHVSEEALPYGGVLNSRYKVDYLVMRKIPAGEFTMGEGGGTAFVTLTQAFYAGVFQVTQGQWYKVMGTSPAAFSDAASQALRPVEMVKYEDIRGTAAQGGAGWPANSNVYGESFVGRLRAKTGNIDGFDLPTDAQWEYACRAKTDTYFNDGDASANASGANAKANVWLDALGRYSFGGGLINGVENPGASCGPANGSAIVGSYLPNTWGLYDMHGNVWEWCLDWHASSLGGGTNPKGAVSGTARVRRGGGWVTAASGCRSASRSSSAPTSGDTNRGFRIVRTLP